MERQNMMLYNFKIDPELLAQFKKIATKNDRPVSRELRRLIQEAVANDTADE